MLRQIYRSSKKNDRADAEKLAKLLHIGEVPAVYVPSPQVRAWRELITFRRRIVEKRTRARNGIRGLLAEAAWQATRRSPGVRAFRDRIAREDPQRRKIATVATAHYLIRVMWSMLKHNTTWTEPKLVA